MTPEQCRAACKALGWSQEALADKAALSVSSVRAFELGKASPRGYGPGSIQRAFAAAGVEFAADLVDGAECESRLLGRAQPTSGVNRRMRVVNLGGGR